MNQTVNERPTKLIWQGVLELTESEGGFGPPYVKIGDVEIGPALAHFVGALWLEDGQAPSGWWSGDRYCSLVDDAPRPLVRLTIEIIDTE